jgi:hypothetical protein
LQRRWQIAIDDAEAAAPSNTYVDGTDRQSLHNYAFSRQCWTYSDLDGPSGADSAKNLCTNNMEQYGFKSNWWQNVPSTEWNNANILQYFGPPADPHSYQGLIEFGRFRMCRWSSATGCSPGSDVYLTTTHPSFRFPGGLSNPQSVAPTGGQTICDPYGPYAPTLTFPATATSGSEGADGGDTMLGRITPADPPPPAAPPSPPAAPPPPSHFVVFLDDTYRTTANSNTQPFCNRDKDRHVTTGAECFENVPVGNTRDTEMLTSPSTWHEGHRCALDRNGTWRWTNAAPASLYGIYLCRSAIADNNGYLYSASVQNIRIYAHAFYDNMTIPFARGVRSTDVAYVNTQCGVFCAVDEAIVGALTINGTSCSTVNTAMVAYSDSDYC